MKKKDRNVNQVAGADGVRRARTLAEGGLSAWRPKSVRFDDQRAVARRRAARPNKGRNRLGEE